MENNNMKEYNTYEEAKKRLEEIAAQIENKDITLQQTIDLYQEGAKLTAFCYEKLKEAQLKFSQISSEKIGDSNEE